MSSIGVPSYIREAERSRMLFRTGCPCPLQPVVTWGKSLKVGHCASVAGGAGRRSAAGHAALFPRLLGQIRVELDRERGCVLVNILSRCWQVAMAVA